MARQTGGPRLQWDGRGPDDGGDRRAGLRLFEAPRVYRKMNYTGQLVTEQFEGLSLTAYQDSRGVWTIGYGHTAGVTEGMTCTQAQAGAWLTEDIQWAVSVVQNEVTVPLTQGEFNA